MDSGNNNLSRHVPATLELARLLLNPNRTEAAALQLALRKFEAECKSDLANLAQEFSAYFYYLLNEQGHTNALSDDLLELLRNDALHAAGTSVARRHIIRQVGEKLADTGIDAVLLKGAAMDRCVHPEQAFRLGCDIDLLVRERDYARVDEALAPLAEHQEKYPGRSAFSAFAVEKPFYVSSPTPVYLDVHRNLTIPHIYRLEPGDLFDRAQPHPAEPRLLVMSPEDNLLHFAVHSFYDMRLFNKQTLDAYQLIKCSEVDWGVLEINARKYKMGEPLDYFLCGLRAAFDMRGAGMPDKMGHPTSSKRWVMEKLLLASPTALAKRGIGYRARQLSCQLLLSGNIWGYINYNLAYAHARLRT